MMDETEIKLEFPNYENQCRVCLSIGRKLSYLGQYRDIFGRLTSGIKYQSQTPIEEIQLCWECRAFLRRANLFQEQANKANEMLLLGQRFLYGTQSNLTTIILNDTHPHTIFINDLNVLSDTKVCGTNSDDNDDEINDVCELGDDVGDDCFKTEEMVKDNTDAVTNTPTCNNDTHKTTNNPLQESNPQPSIEKKRKINRWAKKRALQNKKPKFKIITDFNKNCFRRVQIDGQELYSIMESERDSIYFKSNKYRCENCIAVFVNEGRLKKHCEKFHIKPTNYKCDICTSSIKNKRQLSQHVAEHYNKFACTLCDFSCYDQSQARWHQQKRHRKIFQCLKCQLKFGSRWDFFKHYKEWHEKFVCDYCGISFKMRYCIKDHIRKQHSPFECKPCNKRWARYNGLWLHNKTAHEVHKVAYCVECDKQYRDVYRYRWHLANSTRHTQHKKHRVPCPGCDKIFSKNIYMKDHYNLVHLKFYKYRCEKCDKNFIRNADLVKHTRRVHEGILPPKNKICYMCGRGFSTNKILTNHLRTHTGEKPFACSICNARFAQSTALSAHARAIHHTNTVQQRDNN